MERKSFARVFLLIVGLLLLICFVQIPIPYNHTLNAFKLETNGNSSGTVQISLTGTKYLSLFNKDQLIANIQEFDNNVGFTVSSKDFQKFLGEDFLHNTFVVCDIGSADDIMSENYTPTTYKYSVSLSEDFERLLIYVSSSQKPDEYYVASINEKHSIVELTEYFKNRIP